MPEREPESLRPTEPERLACPDERAGADSRLGAVDRCWTPPEDDPDDRRPTWEDEEPRDCPDLRDWAEASGTVVRVMAAQSSSQSPVEFRMVVMVFHLRNGRVRLVGFRTL